MARIGAATWQPIVLIMIVAILGLYLFSQFFVKDTEGWTFQVPTDAQGNPVTSTVGMTALKIIIIGAALLLGMTLASKAGMPLSKRDAFTLILIGIGIWFLWENVLKNLLNTASLDQITFSVGQKMGILKP